MREYETTFILQPEISDEGVQELRGRLGAVLDKGGAMPLIFDDQGRRRMAYEIQKFQKGRYVAFAYLDGGKSVPDLERALRLEDSVLRFLTVLVSEEVKDIEARKAEAAEQERIQAQKAAERAEREAADAAERAAREAEEAAARQASEESDDDEEDRSPSRDDDDSGDDERDSDDDSDDDEEG